MDKSVGMGVLLSLGSWVVFYCGTRTLVNSLEAVMTVSALALWPGWMGSVEKPKGSEDSGGSGSVVMFLLLAGAAVALRPTAAVQFFFVFGWHMLAVINRGAVRVK